LNEVFQQHFKALSIPVFSGFALGHVKNKYSVPIGEEVTMDADKFTLQLKEEAVNH
jgi:muramoyltetrapeptide carboxypeptidase